MPDKPVTFNRKSAELIGRTVKNLAGRGRGEAPTPRRRRDTGGGGAGAIESKFAVVTDAAGASTHGADGIEFGSVGKCVLLDDDGAKTSSDPADKIEFKSVHRVGIPVDAIIEISAPGSITAGSTWQENKVLGQFVDCVDYLWQLQGQGEKKSLAVPEGGDAADDIQWLGGAC